MLRKTNGAAIRALREAIGIRQSSLAARAEMSKSYLCEIELGAHQPEMPVVQRIAAVLGVTLDAITYPVPDPDATAEPVSA